MVSTKLNGLYVGFYQIFALAFPLILAPYLGRVLGAEGLGQVAFAQAIAGLFLFLAGLGTGVYGQRLIAQHLGNREDLTRCFFEMVILRFVTTSVALIFFITYILLFGPSIEALLYILLIDFLVMAIDISWLLYGVQNIRGMITLQLAAKAVAVFLILSLVTEVKDVGIYLVCLLAPKFVAYLFMWQYAPRHLNMRLVSNINLVQHIPGVVVLVLPFIATMLINIVDRIMIGVMAGELREVGLYEYAFKFPAIIIGLTSAVTTVLLTRFTLDNNAVPAGTLPQSVNKAAEVVLYYTTFFCVVLFSFSSELLLTVLGADFEEASVALKCLVVMTFVKALTTVVGSGYMIAVGKERDFVYCIWLGLFANVIANILLIPVFGYVGAAISSVLSELLVFYAIMRKLDIGLSSSLTRLVLIYFGVFSIQCLVYSVAETQVTVLQKALIVSAGILLSSVCLTTILGRVFPIQFVKGLVNELRS